MRTGEDGGFGGCRECHREYVVEDVDKDVFATVTFALFGAISIAKDHCKLEHLFVGVGDAEICADVADVEAPCVGGHKLHGIFVGIVAPL